MHKTRVCMSQRRNTSQMAAVMKKTFYYNYLPAKEEGEEPTTMRSRVDRRLVEIRDDFPPATEPWKIEKRLTLGEISTGKLMLSEKETVEHVFRYWALEKCNQVLTGNRVCVLLYDVTVEGKPSVHGPCDENTALEKGVEDNCFFLRVNTCLLHDWALRRPGPGVKITLYWNYVSNAFYLRLFH